MGLGTQLQLQEYLNRGDTSSIPFPETWALDEDGIHVQFDMGYWPNAVDFLRIIPFWHEAE